VTFFKVDAIFHRKDAKAQSINKFQKTQRPLLTLATEPDCGNYHSENSRS